MLLNDTNFTLYAVQIIPQPPAIYKALHAPISLSPACYLCSLHKRVIKLSLSDKTIGQTYNSHQSDTSSRRYTFLTCESSTLCTLSLFYFTSIITNKLLAHYRKRF